MTCKSLLSLSAAIIAAGILLPSCGGSSKKNGGNANYTYSGGTVSATSGNASVDATIMATDESFQRIMEQEIEVYEYQYPKENILSYYLPEQQCIDSLLMRYDVSMIVIPRDLNKYEAQTLAEQNRKYESHPIAVDAVALIVNPQNPANSITVSDLRQVLTGKIKSWDMFEPNNNSGPIKVVFDYNGSSTISYMRDKVCEGEQFGDNVYAQNSNQKVFEYVAHDKGAIGIIGVSWISSDLRTAGKSAADMVKTYDDLEKENDVFTPDPTFDGNVKVLGVAKDNVSKAYKPYQAYIYEKDCYPFVRVMWMINVDGRSSLANRFLSFVTGPLGQKLMLSTGVLPYRMLANHWELE